MLQLYLLLPPLVVRDLSDATKRTGVEAVHVIKEDHFAATPTKDPQLATCGYHGVVASGTWHSWRRDGCPLVHPCGARKVRAGLGRGLGMGNGQGIEPGLRCDFRIGNTLLGSEWMCLWAQPSTELMQRCLADSAKRGGGGASPEVQRPILTCVQLEQCVDSETVLKASKDV